MAPKPDWSQIFINHHYWRPEYGSFGLPPGGYLIAVGVRHADDSKGIMVDPDNTGFWRGSFSLRRENDERMGVPPLGILNWRYELNQCGIAFPTPIPDVNNANQLIIRRDAPKSTDATLLVTTVHTSFL